jgi:hypothetical protein
MRATFQRSSLITTTASAQNFASSRFDNPRGTVRYGVIPKPRAPYEKRPYGDSREPKTPVIRPRDMYLPDLHIDTLKVKARNFR